MRIEKGSISREIDERNFDLYVEKGYKKAEKPKAKAVKGEKNA